MINYLDYKHLSRKQAHAILKELIKIGKINPNLKHFKTTYEHNERGDYGIDELYYYSDRIFFVISVDGARQSIEYFAPADYEIILEIAKNDAKKEM
jgi:hypothetical protein